MSAAALTGARLLGQETGVDKFAHLPPDRRAAAEAAYARMWKAFAFERVTVPGSEALATWEHLRAAGQGSPVIVGDDEQLEILAAQFSIDDPAAFGSPLSGPPRSGAAILAAADRLRWPDDLSKWEGGNSPDDLKAPVGDWPAQAELPNVQPPGLSVATDLVTGKLLPSVHIVILPTRASAEVPAYLRWGGWNACPPPEYHVAALRSWHKRYGAELVSVNGDTMDIRVSRRPSSREEAQALAHEQYRYCPDIVDQGVATLSALAAGLMGSDWWYLWWD